MQYCKKKAPVILVIAFFLITVVPIPAAAQEHIKEVSGEGMVFDFVLLRPLGIAATALGCVFFVASLPFTVWSKNRIAQAGEHLVVVPAKYTFVRPLGELKDGN